MEHLKSAGLVAKTLVPMLDLSPSTDLVVVSHSRCFTKAKKFQTYLRDELGGSDSQVGLALVVRRPTHDASQPAEVDLVGDVKDKDVLIVDDVVDSGRSIARAALKARAAGAKRVFAFASHALLSKDAPTTLQACDPLERVVVLNTVPVTPESRAACPKLHVVDVAPMLSDAIKELHVPPS